MESFSLKNRKLIEQTAGIALVGTDGIASA